MKVIFIIGDENLQATSTRWQQLGVKFRTKTNLWIALRLCTAQCLRETERGLEIGYYNDIQRGFTSAWLPKSKIEMKNNLIIVPDWIDHPCAFPFLIDGSFSTSEELENARRKAVENLASLTKEELETFLLAHAQRGASEIIWKPQSTEKN